MIIEEKMYVRTKKGIAKIESLDDLDNVAWTDRKGVFFGIKRPSGMLHFELDDDGYVIGIPSYNIIDLIEPMDLLFIDIDNGYHGGIIVPRIPETLNELNEIKEKINSEELVLKGIVTKEQIKSIKYEVK